METICTRHITQKLLFPFVVVVSLHGWLLTKAKVCKMISKNRAHEMAKTHSSIHSKCWWLLVGESQVGCAF